MAKEEKVWSSLRDIKRIIVDSRRKCVDNFSKISLFKQILAYTEHSNADIRAECLLLLAAAVPHLDHSTDSFLRDHLPYLTIYLGEEDFKLRLPAINFFYTYSKHTRNFERFYQIFLENAIENKDVEIQRGSILCAITFKENFSKANFFKLLLTSMLKNISSEVDLLIYTTYEASNLIRESLSEHLFFNILHSSGRSIYQRYMELMNGKRKTSCMFPCGYDMLKECLNDDESKRYENLLMIRSQLRNCKYTISDLLPHVHQFLKFVGYVLSDRSVKIQVIGLNILEAIMERLGCQLILYLKQYLRCILPTLGRYERRVKKQSISLIHRVMQFVHPMVVMKALIMCAKVNCIFFKAEIINRITAGLFYYSQYYFDFETLCQEISVFLEDSVLQVRQVAIECFVTLGYVKSMTGLAVSDLLDVLKVSKHMPKSVLNSIISRIKKGMLPSCTQEGIVSCPSYQLEDSDTTLCFTSDESNIMTPIPTSNVYLKLQENFHHISSASANTVLKTVENNFLPIVDGQEKENHFDSTHLESAISQKHPVEHLDSEKNYSSTPENSMTSGQKALSELASEISPIENLNTSKRDSFSSTSNSIAVDEMQRNSRASLCSTSGRSSTTSRISYVDSREDAKNSSVSEDTEHPDTPFDGSGDSLQFKAKKKPFSTPAVVHPRKQKSTFRDLSSRVLSNAGLKPQCESYCTGVEVSEPPIEQKNFNIYTHEVYSSKSVEEVEDSIITSRSTSAQTEESSKDSSSIFLSEEEQETCIFEPDNTHNSYTSSNTVDIYCESRLEESCNRIPAYDGPKSELRSSNSESCSDMKAKFQMNASKKTAKFNANRHLDSTSSALDDSLCNNSANRSLQNDGLITASNNKESLRLTKGKFSKCDHKRNETYVLTKPPTCAEQKAPPEPKCSKQKNSNCKKSCLLFCTCKASNDSIKINNITFRKSEEQQPLPKTTYCWCSAKKKKQNHAFRYHYVNSKYRRSLNQMFKYNPNDMCVRWKKHIGLRSEKQAKKVISITPVCKDQSEQTTFSPLPQDLNSDTAPVFDKLCFQMNPKSKISEITEKKKQKNPLNPKVKQQIVSKKSCQPELNELKSEDEDEQTNLRPTERRLSTQWSSNIEFTRRNLTCPWAESFEEKIKNQEPFSASDDTEQILKHACDQISKDDMIAKEESMLSIIRLAKFEPEVLEDYQVNKLVIQLLADMKNLRPSIAGQAGLTLGYLYMIMQKPPESIKQKLRIVISALLKKSGNRTFAGSHNAVIKSLFYVVKGMPLQKTTMAIIFEGARHPNKAVRETAAQFLTQLTEKLGPNRSLSSGMSELMLNTAAQFLTDGSALTRHCGKLMFSVFLQNQNFEKLMEKHLADKIKMSISKVLKNVAKDGVEKELLPIDVIWDGNVQIKSCTL